MGVVEDREVRGVERKLEFLGDREDPIDEVCTSSSPAL